MKGKKVLKWALGIFVVLIILIALFGEDKQTQQPKQEQQQTQLQAQPQQPQSVDYEKSVFSKEIVDAIVDKLSPLRAKGYTIKTNINRGVGEYSKNFTYSARIEKDYKNLASVIYSSVFYHPNFPPSPSYVSIYLNCRQERGLLYGCANPQKDPDGFFIIKSFWDVVGLKDEDLSKVLNVISSAYKKKNPEDTRLTTKLNLTGANGIDYILIVGISLTVDKEGDRVVIKPIIEDIKLELYEREHYEKAYGFLEKK